MFEFGRPKTPINMKHKNYYKNNIDNNNQYYNVPNNSFIPNINNNNLEKEIILLKNEVKEIKTNIKDINKEIKDMKYLLNEIYNIIKYNNNNSNYNNITENKLIKNLNNQPKDNNINDDRKVTVSMGDKNILIIINNDTSFNAFKIIIQKYLNLNSNDIDIYYFNNFAKKIYVSNDITFKNSIAQKICKYYKRRCQRNIGAFFFIGIYFFRNKKRRFYQQYCNSFKYDKKNK